MTEIQDFKKTAEEYTAGDRDVINKVALSFDRRRFRQASQLLENLLHNNGWLETVRLLQSIPVRSTNNHYGRSWWMKYCPSEILPVSLGKLRDGQLNILGLECVNGIDVDLLKTFGGFKAGSLQELREKVRTKATIILKKQIGESATFFLDTQKMASTSFRSLIPRIIRRRAEEWNALGSRPSYSRAAKTYYGLAHLTESLTQDDKTALHQLCETSPEFTGKRPSYHRSTFSHCSNELTDLLLSHLRLTFAGPQTQVKGAFKLGVIADSRSLGVLHAALKKKTPDLLWYADPLNPVKYRVMWALGEIGHPSSLEHLRPSVGDFTFDQSVMYAIAGIDHPDAMDILLERGFNEPPRRVGCGCFPGRNTSEKELLSRSNAIGLLGNNSDERLVRPLLELMQDRGVSSSALHSLARMGKLGLQSIIDNMDLVKRVLGESHIKGYIMEDLLTLNPEFARTDEGISLLLDVLRDVPYLVNYLDSEVLGDSRLRSLVLKVFSESNFPAGHILHINKVGLLDDPDFRETALEMVSSIAEGLSDLGPFHVIGFETLDSIQMVPMIRESEEIQASLVKLIRDMSVSVSVLREIRKHGLDLPVIHDTVIDVLSLEDWSIRFMEEVIKSTSLMRTNRVRKAVAKAMSVFWSAPENPKFTAVVCLDSSRGNYLLRDEFLTPLKEYPEMGRMEEFQVAVSSLLLHTCWPDDVLSLVKEFDDLSECDPLKSAIERRGTRDCDDIGCE